MCAVHEYRPNVDDVRHLARLARMDIPDQQARRLTRDLAAILDLVAGLPAPGTSTPAGPAPDAARVLTEDRPRPGLPHERALAAAPQRGDGLFLVPRVIHR
jgi:aspartyl-tRNA(Asn)/glutamyl-tRNA(Gln) amidotransferase subunit C